VVFALFALILLSWLILICFIIASIETQSGGFFLQQRVGRFGKLFAIIKIKTIHPKTNEVTYFGRYFRELKLDELPQFFNVLKGDMSVVGPRPDVTGYYDLLQGQERKILDLRPGITSEASLKYKNEDEILSHQENPLEYNDRVIFPDKVKMNLEYYQNQSFISDLRIILKTIFPFFKRY
jgi:lipopolysaccharide/colanic/teichoic acid biosynthesis glycosyltransferase